MSRTVVSSVESPPAHTRRCLLLPEPTDQLIGMTSYQCIPDTPAACSKNEKEQGTPSDDGPPSCLYHVLAPFM